MAATWTAPWPLSMRPPMPAATRSSSSFSRSTACSRRKSCAKAPSTARAARWELPLAHLAPLAEHCSARKIQFSCTPFYLEAVAELEPFVDFYKIASYELLVTDLLKACAAHRQAGDPSTGMATMDEIAAAAATLKSAGAARHHPAALRLGLSHAAGGSQSFRHRRDPRGHRRCRPAGPTIPAVPP